MAIVIHEVAPADYQTLAQQFSSLPLWCLPYTLSCYSHTLLLAASKGHQTVALWAIPLTIKDDQVSARREYRCLPYASPYIDYQDNLSRREVAEALYIKLMDYCIEINLPFAPTFVDIAPAQARAVFVEWRHTHLLTQPLRLTNFSSRLRNHILNAQRELSIHLSSTPQKFNFDQAIKGSDSEKQIRISSALNLLSHYRAVVFVAIAKNKIVGEIFIAYDFKVGYLLHSWQDFEAPRGTLSALITHGANWVLENQKLALFDFEGSVIQNVDYFYSGFNVQITPYAQVLWNKSAGKLHALIDRAITIPGRLTM